MADSLWFLSSGESDFTGSVPKKFIGKEGKLQATLVSLHFLKGEPMSIYVRHGVLPEWEPIPWDLSGEAVDEQEKGFHRRATKIITWREIPPLLQDFPTEGILGHSQDWFNSIQIAEIHFFAISDGEDLLLIRRMFHGFPDPPEWGLASRLSGCDNEEWTMWGSFDEIPKTWTLNLAPEKIDAAITPSATLPENMLENASIQDEIGWKMNSFPLILHRAREHGLACLGGQFQFRFEDGTCEMYWLCADSKDRELDESWESYVHRSTDEVSRNFSRVCENANFEKEIDKFEFVRIKREEGIDPMQHLWFVASFVTESEYNDLQTKVEKLSCASSPRPADSSVSLQGVVCRGIGKLVRRILS
jgi:hypothetical protein